MNQKKDLLTLDECIKKGDVDIDSIKFNDREVRDCKYVSISELKGIIERGESTFKNFKDTIFYR